MNLSTADQIASVVGGTTALVTATVSVYLYKRRRDPGDPSSAAQADGTIDKREKFKWEVRHRSEVRSGSWQAGSNIRSWGDGPSFIWVLIAMVGFCVGGAFIFKHLT